MSIPPFVVMYGVHIVAVVVGLLALISGCDRDARLFWAGVFLFILGTIVLTPAGLTFPNKSTAQVSILASVVIQLATLAVANWLASRPR